MNTTTTTAPEAAMLTADLFDHFTRDDRWLGFGYLGGRRNELETGDPEIEPRPDLVAAVDALVIEYANAAGWTVEDLFGWANSKAGRHFADVMFGTAGSPLAARFAKAAKWNLLLRNGGVR